MQYANIEFHNVEALVPCEEGLALSRLPESMLEVLRRRDAEACAFLCSGVELRFRIRSGEAKIYLHMQDVTEGLPAQIMYGSFQGGWMVSAKAIGREKTCITLQQSKNLPELKRITEEKNLPFQPELVRIVLPYGRCVFDGAEGDIQPPQPGDTPAHTLLSYGSSITHGSLALGTLQCYAARMAHTLGYDHINLGLAGNCHLEPEFARYIMQRRDWQMATVEMGINMLSFSAENFQTRVHEFVDILSKETRPVFTTGILGFNGDQKQAELFRRILREETAGKLPHVDGLTLLNDPEMVSEDLVHPTLYGHEQIAQRWSRIIRENSES